MITFIKRSLQRFIIETVLEAFRSGVMRIEIHPPESTSCMKAINRNQARFDELFKKIPLN